jgi:DNA polymerase III epsilon subunit family exonuclease
MINRPQNNIEITPKEIETLLETFPKGIVAFDLEMTGLSPVFDKIIEIAAIKISSDGSIDTFHEMINPLIPIPDYTIQYHQITNEMVRDCPTLKKPLRDFADFFGNLPLIAHNAKFDMGFIVRGHHEYNYPFSLSDIYDSCKFSRAVFKAEKEKRPDNFKLSTLAQFYNFNFTHHQALDDAVISLKVFCACLERYRSYTGKRTLRDLSYLFKFNSFKKPTEYLLPKKLQSIKDKLKTREVIHIKYKGSSTGDNFRPVKPIAIMPMPQGLILYGECGLTKLNKHFMVKKIKDLKID